MGASSIHFSDRELACHHCGVNGCTQQLVDALEALRAVAGVPIRIHDAFRCAKWNLAVPNSASHSQHVLGTAADFSIEGMSAADLYALVLKVPAFHGIGVAKIQNYVHADVRKNDARWNYSATGAVLPWSGV